jgi:Zn-dependent protease with chaperone function
MQEVVTPRREDPEPSARPELQRGQALDVGAVLDPAERSLRKSAIGAGLIVAVLLSLITSGGALVVFALWWTLSLANEALTAWIFYWAVYGEAILVGEDQYPEIYRAVEVACMYLEVRPIPKILVLHGGGVVTLLVAKTFRRRGVLLFTSEVIDATLGAGDSRQLMMIIGRELGHIRAGHYNYNFFLHYLGRLAFPLYASYRRSSERSADRIGLLVCGSQLAARHALVMLTVGRTLSKATNWRALNRQNEELSCSLMAWLLRVLSYREHMIHRIASLAHFGIQLTESVSDTADERAIALLPPEANIFHITIGSIQGAAVFGDGGFVQQSHH